MATLIRRNDDLFPVLPRLWGDDFFTRDLLNWGIPNYAGMTASVPTVNIREKDDRYEVEMAAPGMNKNDFNIELDGNLLTISAEKNEKRNEKNDKEKYICREYSYQSFQRSFTLPKDVVDIDKIKAHYEDGVLQLSIPKKEITKQKHPKTIAVV
jgi:HSP20 family protein